MTSPIKKFPLTKLEQKKYVISTNRDYEILSKVKHLETLNLSKQDKSLVLFLKTQLESDWRKYLIQALNQLLRKYS